MRVMTWNLWWRFGPFEQRLPAIIDTMRQVDADVLCLQEVWSNDERDVADEIAAALGMHAVRTDPVLWNGESFGNAILSRAPLRRVELLRHDGLTSDARGGPNLYWRKVLTGRFTAP